jgi:hypothetical protein
VFDRILVSAEQSCQLLIKLADLLIEQLQFLCSVPDSRPTSWTAEKQGFISAASIARTDIFPAISLSRQSIPGYE